MTVDHLHEPAGLIDGAVTLAPAVPGVRGAAVDHSVVLLAGIALILGSAFFLLWGPAGLLAAAATVGVLHFASPHVPVEAVARLYRAKAVQPGPGNGLGLMVAELARRAGLPRSPALYVIPSLSLNAFAVGRPSRSIIAVTEGALRKLTPREIAGVLAHEVSHVRNDDLRALGLADVMTRLLVALSQAGLVLAALNVFEMLTGEDPVVPWPAIAVLYFAPAVVSLLQLALSRNREFAADAGAVRLTGDPTALASALARLDGPAGSFIDDLNWPMPVRRVAVPSMLRTHPALKERIARLSAMPLSAAQQMDDVPMMTLVGFGPGDMRPRLRWPGVWF